MKKALLIAVVILMVAAAGCINTPKKEPTQTSTQKIAVITPKQSFENTLPLYTYTITPAENRVYIVRDGKIQTLTITSGKISGVPLETFLTYVLPYIADYYEALIVTSNTYSYYDFDTKTLDYTAFGIVYNQKFFATVDGHTGAFYYSRKTFYIGCTHLGPNFTPLPPLVPYTGNKLLFIVDGDYRTLSYYTTTGEYTVYAAPGHWITVKMKNTTQ